MKHDGRYTVLQQMGKNVHVVIGSQSNDLLSIFYLVLSEKASMLLEFRCICKKIIITGQPYRIKANNPNTPQYHRAALSSCVGYLRAHPSPPGTDPRALKHTMGKEKEALTSPAKVSCKYNQVVRSAKNQRFKRKIKTDASSACSPAEGLLHLGSNCFTLFSWSNIYQGRARSS